MPHLYLEYSNNLKFETKPVLLALNQALLDGAYAKDPQDIKSRAIAQDDFMIGLNADPNAAYVHVKLSLLTGRSTELKAQISQVLLETLQRVLPVQQAVSLQLCVELLDMPKECYKKAILHTN